MLVLSVPCGGYVFVYHKGAPIGAILVGKTGPRRSWVSLAFAGDPQEMEVLRPEVVARRHGDEELARLVERFTLLTAQTT